MLTPLENLILETRLLAIDNKAQEKATQRKTKVK